jgi:hypothetical protein
MHPAAVPIDAAMLRRLYLEERLTTEASGEGRTIAHSMCFATPRASRSG